MKPFSDDDELLIKQWLATANHTTHGLIYDRFTKAQRIAAETSEEWLAARVNGIGASEIGVIVGASKWASPYSLWWRKKLDWRLPQTEGQRWGHLVEDPIAELFAEEMYVTLYIAKPRGHPFSLWHHPDTPWMICTPDRLAVNVAGDVIPVELKSDEGGPGWGEPGTAEVPAQYRAQALWQAHIFGAPGTYIVRKTGSGKRRMQWYWVPYNESDLGYLQEAGADFLASIEMGEPPPPDGTEATTDALKDVNVVEPDTWADVPAALAAEWVAARQAKRDATARERLASNKMRAALQKAEYGKYTTTDGLDVVIVKRRVGKRAGYTVAPATTDELRQIGEQPGTDAGLRGDAALDASTAPPHAEEGASQRDLPGDELGGEEAGGEGRAGTRDDPLSAPLCTCGHDGLDRMFHLHPCPVRQVKRVNSIHGIELPPELARLVDNTDGTG